MIKSSFNEFAVIHRFKSPKKWNCLKVNTVFLLQELSGGTMTIMPLFRNRLCTKDRAYLFGNIENEKMHLSETGEIAKRLWKEIPNHFPFVRLAAFVLMPNHLHGIVIIDHPPVETLHATSLNKQVGHVPVETLHATSSNKPENHSPKETLHATSLQDQKNEKMSAISPKTGTLSSIMRSYKSAVTRERNLKTENRYPIWQARFHDHIIRDQAEFDQITGYIIHNPKNFKNDKFFSG